MFPTGIETVRRLTELLRQKASCENTFAAIKNAILPSKACDITGIVGIACARHGCYVPAALVDLVLGEGQKNVDFCVLQAVETTKIDPAQAVLLMYDIVCAYFIHFHDRIGHLLPPGLLFDRAIDHFHVHGHRAQCFFRYVSTFIPGAAIVAGEILESLWSSLNTISPAVRTATLAHRAEVLDDHACDSNHKKLLGMISVLCDRHLEAHTMADRSRHYFAELSAQVSLEMQQQWEDEVKGAEAMRLVNIAAMDIYGAQTAHHGENDQNADPADDIDSHASRWIQFALMVEQKQ